MAREIPMRRQIVRPPAGDPAGGITSIDVWAMMLGGLRFIQFSFVGSISLSECLALLRAPFSNIRALLRQLPLLRLFLFGLGAILSGLIVADIANQALPADFLRGWGSVVVSGVSTVVLAALFHSRMSAIYWYLGALALSRLLFGAGDLSTELLAESTNYFKVRFVPFLFPAIVLLAAFVHRRHALPAAAVLGVGALLFVALDARNSGACLLVAALLVVLVHRQRRLSRRSIILGGLTICMVGYGAYAYYVTGVLNHQWGGSNASQLLLAEQPYNPLELLYYGRSAFFVCVDAANATPLVGRGSWAMDQTGYYRALELSRVGRPMLSEPGLIPCHSVVLTAWLWGGLLGLIGVAIVVIALFRAFLGALVARARWTPIVAAYGTQLAWDLLFSPFGHLRVSIPFVAALLISGVAAGAVARQARQRASAPPQASIVRT